MTEILFRRTWAMPTKHTFDCPPIGEMVKRYLRQSKISVDPFSGNKRWATHTNDLNPDTPAEHHLDALDFLQLMVLLGIQADLVIFDPPYSPRQIKECYNGIGLKMKSEDTWRTHGWSQEKDCIAKMLSPEGVFLYFGWDTVGMGKGRGFGIIEGLIVCHGPGHNDTLCIAEKRLPSSLYQQTCLPSEREHENDPEFDAVCDALWEKYKPGGSEVEEEKI